MRFSCLPDVLALHMRLCRYDEFFFCPPAHCAINGVIKPFWNLPLRKPKTTWDQNDHLRITKAQQAET